MYIFLYPHNREELHTSLLTDPLKKSSQKQIIEMLYLFQIQYLLNIARNTLASVEVSVTRQT